MYTGKQFDRTRVVGSFVSKRGYLRRQWCARRLPTSSYKRSAMGSRRAETLHRLATIYAALDGAVGSADGDDDDEDVIARGR